MNKLLFAFIILIATGSLHSMKSRRQLDQIIEQPHNTLTHHLSPISLPMTYHYLRNFLLPEVVQLIFSFHLGNVDLAQIKTEQICKDPGSLVKSIQLTLASCDSRLTIELYKQYLCNISLFNIKNSYNETPLHSVIQNIKDAKYCLNLAQILIKIADNNTWPLLSMQDEDNETALHPAARNGHTEVVKVLLDAAGDNAWTLLTMRDKDNETALHIAAGYGYTEAVKVLLEAAGDNTWTLLTMRDRDNKTALHIAARKGRAEVVKVLLDAAGNNTWTFLTTQNEYNNTALHYAALYGGTEIVKILLNAADNDVWTLLAMQNEDNNTALHIAAGYDHSEVVKILLDAAGDKVQDLSRYKSALKEKQIC
jgi:ankyrin repeat protein